MIDAKAGADGALKIPQAFNLGLRIFKNGEGYKLTARLKETEELRRRYTERITSRLMDGKQCMLLQFLGDDVRRNKA